MINESNLRKRLLFVAWAIPLGWWIVNSNFNLLFGLQPHWNRLIPAQILAVLLIILGGFEYTKLLSNSFRKNAFWLAMLWLFVHMLLELYGNLKNTNNLIPMRFSIFLLLVIVAVEAIFWGNKEEGRWKRASLLFSGMVFLNIAGTSLLNMYEQQFQHLFLSFKPEMLSQMGVVAVVGSVFLCDSGAYFVGSLFGRNHYSSISPNKTIEGSVGGLVTAILTCSICWAFWGNPIYPAWTGVVIGLLAGIAALAGDMLISLIKRYFDVKDASEMIPGHGGILDRFGSVFFAIPTIELFMWLLNKFVVA